MTGEIRLFRISDAITKSTAKSIYEVLLMLKSSVFCAFSILKIEEWEMVQAIRHDVLVEYEADLALQRFKPVFTIELIKFLIDSKQKLEILLPFKGLQIIQRCLRQGYRLLFKKTKSQSLGSLKV